MLGKPERFLIVIPKKLASLERDMKIILSSDIGAQGVGGETYTVEHVGEYDPELEAIELILSGMIYDDEGGLKEGVVTYHLDGDDFEIEN